jgi:hypothetical protein
LLVGVSARRGALALAVAVTAVLAAAPAAWAQDDHAVIDPQQQAIDAAPQTEGIEVGWRAGGVVPARQVPDRLVAGPQATPGGGSAPAADSLSAGPPSAGGADGPQATDGLIANHGCAQLQESEVLPQGQNCIDTARIYADGKVHVHTQVPTMHFVSINDEPALDGTAAGGVRPLFGSGNLQQDQSTSRVYDFWTKPFELVQGTTYYISATATDSEGNLSWRYGDVTVPVRMSRIVFDRIHVLSDGDKDGVIENKGEIQFDFSVNGTKYHHRPEHKIGSGDWLELDDAPGRPPNEYDVGLVAAPRFAELYVRGQEQDPGDCIVEAGGPPWDSSGCDIATAAETIDLDDVVSGTPSLPGPQNQFVLYTGDYHLEFAVYGHWETEFN